MDYYRKDPATGEIKVLEGVSRPYTIGDRIYLIILFAAVLGTMAGLIWGQE